jgi:hypothetical protein
MAAADFLNDRIDTLAPCRDARVLAWLVDVLGADMLLDIIDSQTGGTLGDRVKRELARERIEELA